MYDTNPPPASPDGASRLLQETQIPPSTPIDMAVNFMLPEGDRRRDEFAVTAVHDIDIKYVQTAASDMCQGDTLILLEIPRHKPNRTCSGGSFPFSYRLRFRSWLLRDCGLDLFPRLLDDKKYQAKNRARLTAKQLIPEGIDYILDLGPSSDEDLHSSHLEILTLSKGVMRWFRTALVPPKIDKALVFGHDDSCECALKYHPSLFPKTDEAEPEPRGCLWDGLDEGPRFREIIEDYCEVRHTANVVRLLRRIMGRAGSPTSQLIFDSAPRVFTIAGLARLFELNFSDRSDWLRNDIRNWFLAGMNSHIIEILAEDAIIVGYNVKIHEVTRAAYRILASEYALQLESSSPPPRGGHMCSVFGRPLRDINNDVIQTAIEHGGRALAERILGTLAHVLSDQFLDWLELDEWRKIRLLERRLKSCAGDQAEAEGVRRVLAACTALEDAILRFVRDRVEDARSTPGEGAATNGYSAGLAHFTPIPQRVKSPKQIPGQAPGREFLSVWNTLNDNQKALTSVFWKRLGTAWPRSHDAPSASDFQFPLLARDLNDAIHINGFSIPGYVPEYFDIVRLLVELEDKVTNRLCIPLWGTNPDHTHPDLPHQHNFYISSHMLLALNDNEMRFLPLWADGLNDESGGVYDNGEVPPPIQGLGPSGPGPSFHTGRTVGTETTNSTVSDLGIGDMDVQSYTTETQTFEAHRGPSSVAPSTGGPAISEDMDFDDARLSLPVDRQPAGQAVALLMPCAGQPAQTYTASAKSVFGLSDDEDEDYGFDSGSTTPAGSVANAMEVDDRNSDSDWSMT